MSFFFAGTLITEGMTLREGDIAASNRIGSKTCFARSCLWAKSVDGHVYIAYTFSPEYSKNAKTTNNETWCRGMQ